MPAAHTPAPAVQATLCAVLAGRLVRPMFQPIVDLAGGGVVGLEALARGPAGSTLEFPDQLFAAAGAAGLLGELDMLCAERALEEALAAPVAPPLLFVNGEPAVMDQPLSPRLLELVTSGLPFRHVLELTERALPAVPGSLLRIAAVVQDLGNSLALDDVGVDPASLALLPVFEPELIKLDMSLIHHPHTPATRTVCEVVRAEAERTGAVVIAEGIETPEQLRTALDLGAHWGQGWLFGRPGPIGRAAARYDARAAAALRAPRPGFHRPSGTPFQTAAAHRRPVPGTAESVADAVDRLRDIVAADSAVVVVVSTPPAADGLTDALQQLVGRTRSVIMLDEPVPDEFAVTMLGAGYGAALCVSTTAEPQMVLVDDLPTVAAITRALLDRS